MHRYVHSIRNPIPGQLEVAGSASGTAETNIWLVKEGIYFAAKRAESAKADNAAHDEL
jgi:hypothetical protein